MFNTGGGGGTADYVYMLLLGALVVLVTGSLFGLGVFFGRHMIYYVLYVWSKRNPTAQVSRMMNQYCRFDGWMACFLIGGFIGAFLCAKYVYVLECV